MSELKELLTKLGWSKELIEAFTVDRDFPTVESKVQYELDVKSVDSSNLVISTSEKT